MRYKAGDEPIRGFRLVKWLGSGGFGEVWKAEGAGGIALVIKVIPLDRQEGQKELRALSRIKLIRHPNLVPLLGCWLRDEEGNVVDESAFEEAHRAASSNEDGTFRIGKAALARAKELIIAMGLGDMTLGDRLKQCQQAGLPGIPVDELLSYIACAARGIDFLNFPRADVHPPRESLQHCDIKPANIVVVGDLAQVCDFGLVRALDDVRRSAMAVTPAYGAPELIGTGIPSTATDQYSLGISYYELRTGALPFPDTNSALQVLEAHRTGKLDFSRLAEAERAVLRKATSVEPADRYPTCQQMVTAMHRAVAAEQAAGGGAPLPEIHQYWTPPMAAIVTPAAPLTGSGGVNTRPVSERTTMLDPPLTVPAPARRTSLLIPALLLAALAGLVAGGVYFFDLERQLLFHDAERQPVARVDQAGQHQPDESTAAPATHAPDSASPAEAGSAAAANRPPADGSADLRAAEATGGEARPADGQPDEQSVQVSPAKPAPVGTPDGTSAQTNAATTPPSREDAISAPPIKTSDDKPPKDPPASETVRDDTPHGEQPSTDAPSTQKPAGEKPASDKPVDDKPAHDKPAEDKPEATEPAERPQTGDLAITDPSVTPPHKKRRKPAGKPPEPAPVVPIGPAAVDEPASADAPDAARPEPVGGEPAKPRPTPPTPTPPEPVKLEPQVTNTLGMKLVLVPAGEFVMGSPAGKFGLASDDAQHRVQITKPFYVGACEVTQEEFARVMGRNPSWFGPQGGGKRGVSAREPGRLPVENISWLDAADFCRKLTGVEGATYRLPTEAEWEYACRAGTTSAFSFGDAASGTLANCGNTLAATAPVGGYPPNAFGLYDMHGNVAEWCSDWFDKEYYAKSPLADPVGAVAGELRVYRGGNWASHPDACASPVRAGRRPKFADKFTGFRVLCEIR